MGWCCHPATEDHGVGWESQKRGRYVLMLDVRREANSVGTHGRWRKMHLVPILKEEWGLNRK